MKKMGFSRRKRALYPHAVKPLPTALWVTGVLEVRKLTKRQLVERLGYKNINKGFRRLDAFLDGDIEDPRFKRRIRQCCGFYDESFERSLQEARAKIRADDRAERLLAELKQGALDVIARAEHVPHLWFEHLFRFPSSIIAVAHCGEEFFRRVALPADILEVPEGPLRLMEIRNIIRMIKQDRAGKVPMETPFGRAIRVLYRDTFDHAWVFDIETLDVIGERHAPPRVGKYVRGRPGRMKRFLR